MLKHVLDAFVHLGQRATASAGILEQKEKGTVQEDAKDICCAIFDILDRDGDGKVTADKVRTKACVFPMWLCKMCSRNGL